MSGDERETHPLNSTVTRIPGGIWFERELPVLVWELPTYRVVVPEELVPLVGDLGPVLRWSAAKLNLMQEQRPLDAIVLHDLSQVLARWTWMGRERAQRSSAESNDNDGELRYRILSAHRGRWYAVSLGRDKAGSDNVITVIGSRDRSFLRNRLNGLDEVRERGW